MPLFDNNSEERGEVWGKSKGNDKEQTEWHRVR